MSTYRVVTATKTVYVHNVDPTLGAEIRGEVSDEDHKDNGELVIYRVGGPTVSFPWVNVVSYEVRDGDRACGEGAGGHRRPGGDGPRCGLRRGRRGGSRSGSNQARPPRPARATAG